MDEGGIIVKQHQKSLYFFFNHLMAVAHSQFRVIKNYFRKPEYQWLADTVEDEVTLFFSYNFLHLILSISCPI